MPHDRAGCPSIIRTERGLMVAGTRITLYDTMGYLVEDWLPGPIRDRLSLTEQQMAGALSYIESHRAEVEAEYEQVPREAEATRQYWEERNRERMAQIAAMAPRPGQEAIRAKLLAHKAAWRPLE